MQIVWKNWEEEEKRRFIGFWNYHKYGIFRLRTKTESINGNVFMKCINVMNMHLWDNNKMNQCSFIVSVWTCVHRFRCCIFQSFAAENEFLAFYPNWKIDDTWKSFACTNYERENRSMVYFKITNTWTKFEHTFWPKSNRSLSSMTLRLVNHLVLL